MSATVDVDHLAEVAAQMAARVRDERPEDVAAWLAAELPDPADLWRLLFVQAAAIPVDVPWLSLTSWAHHLDPAAAIPASVAAEPLDAELDLELDCATVAPGRQPPPVRVAVAVVDKLTGQGLSAEQIAGRLGVSPRTVQRHRHRIAAAAGATAAARPGQVAA